MIKGEYPLKSIFLKILKYFIIIFFSLQIIRGEDSLDVELNLDSLWENYEWEEIQEVTDVYAEVEQITAVAGVRGSEAKYEIFKYLYYRKSMKSKKIKKN
tara:strand:+ start:269 stop:568 length:300 start_codon:yes stop_codon:yes gene_type:complete